MAGCSIWLAGAVLCMWIKRGTPEEPLCPTEVSGGFHHPTHVVSTAGGTLLVSEQPGRILQVSGSARTVVLDLRNRTVTSETPFEERGLLSFALDTARLPDALFVCYCAPPTRPDQHDHDILVSRFPLLKDGRGRFRANSSGELRLLAVGQPGASRNGGYLFFGPPDGSLLYVTLGSGGGPDDDKIRFDTGSLLGKILRLNVSNTDPSVAYTIPTDNPFAGADPPGARQEIFALGFWNPWRCAVDPQPGGRVFCGDVGAGPNNTDLVVILVSGGIYGCPPDCQEKNLPITGNRLLREPQRAIYAHKHETGQALIGGPLYRGTGLPQLMGAYIFGDFVHGSLHALWEGKPGQQWTMSDIALDKKIPGRFFILSVSTDYYGEPLLTVASDLKSSSATGSIYSLRHECTDGSASCLQTGHMTTAILVLFHLLVREGWSPDD